MVKNILLDLDGTIFDFLKSEAVALSKTLINFNIKPTDELIKLYSRINESQWKLLETGELTREQILVGRFEIFFKEIGVDISGKDARYLYENYLSESHYFIDHAEELLEELSKKYSLYIASNGTAKVQSGRIKSSSISRFFKEIFISENIGFNKPDKRFFDYCFSKISNFSLSETIIIGDSLSSDILGGNNAGIKTIWFNRNFAENNTQVVVDKEVHSLTEIPDVIEKM